jgi:DNA-binding transcriptional regulator YhcF (GntR family)
VFYKPKNDPMENTPFTDQVRAENPGVEIRGDETFGELTEKMGPADDRSFVVKDFNKNLDQLSFARFNKAYKDLDIDEKDSILDTMKKIGDEVFGTKKEGLGSLFPKGEPGSIFDQKNSNRLEVAEFMKAMRAAGIKNEDVMEVIKDKTDFKRQPAYEFFGSDKPKEVVDLAEGKKAATTLARAADMAADTKIKQELLANLDDDIANYGPDWWKGMGYNEGPMGRESVGNLLESITTDINNGVIDDLVAAGMEEDKVFEIMRYMGRDVRERLKFDPKGFIRKVAEELEFNDIKYDMTFWDKLRQMKF